MADSVSIIGKILVDSSLIAKYLTDNNIFKYNTKRLHSAIDYQTPNEVYYQAVNNLTPKGEKELPKAS